MKRDDKLLDPNAVTSRSAPLSLSLPGCQEFNRIRERVEPSQMCLIQAGKEPPMIECVIYLDKGSHIGMPALNPCSPLVSRMTDTSNSIGLQRQWLQVTSVVAEEVKRTGLASTVCLLT